MAEIENGCPDMQKGPTGEQEPKAREHKPLGQAICPCLPTSTEEAVACAKLESSVVTDAKATLAKLVQGGAKQSVIQEYQKAVERYESKSNRTQ